MKYKNIFPETKNKCEHLLVETDKKFGSYNGEYYNGIYYCTRCKKEYGLKIKQRLEDKFSIFLIIFLYLLAISIFSIDMGIEKGILLGTVIGLPIAYLSFSYEERKYIEVKRK